MHGPSTRENKLRKQNKKITVNHPTKQVDSIGRARKQYHCTNSYWAEKRCFLQNASYQENTESIHSYEAVRRKHDPKHWESNNTKSYSLEAPYGIDLHDYINQLFASVYLISLQASIYWS